MSDFEYTTEQAEDRYNDALAERPWNFTTIKPAQAVALVYKVAALYQPIIEAEKQLNKAVENIKGCREFLKRLKDESTDPTSTAVTQTKKEIDQHVRERAAIKKEIKTLNASFAGSGLELYQYAVYWDITIRVQLEMAEEEAVAEDTEREKSE